MILISDQLNELAKALAAFQAEVPAIPKTSNNPFFKSKYADLAAVKTIADPIAAKHGLCVSQWPSSNERGDSLVTLLLHSSGQFIQSEMDLHPVKVDPQAHGSAITYGRRYAYMAALGLVADEDDDGNAASKPSNKPAYTPKQAPVSSPEQKQTTVRKPPTKQTNIVQKLEETFTVASEPMRRTVLNRATKAGVKEAELYELCEKTVGKTLDDSRFSVDDVNKMLEVIGDSGREF